MDLLENFLILVIIKHKINSSNIMVEYNIYEND